MSEKNNIVLKKHPLRITTVMALAVFGVITTEFGLIGALQMMADSFNTSLSTAGTLLSAYAIVVAVFGPFITLTFAKYNKKFVLAGAVGMFFVSTSLSTVSNSFTLMLISRILAALAHSLIWSLALAIAANCFEPERRAKSVSYVNLGFIIATIIGIPLSSFLQAELSWRWGFALSAFSNFVALIAIITLVPSLPGRKELTFGSQVGVLKKPIVWLNITSASTIFAAMFGMYGYFAPYFSQTTGMSPKTISLMLMLFGLSGVIGNIIFGKITKIKNIAKILLCVIIALLLTYTLMGLFNNSVLATLFIILLWGVLFSAGGVVAQVWCTMNATEAPEFANSLYVSFANVGITLGTVVGSLIIKYEGVSSITFGPIFFLLLGLIIYLFTIKKMKKIKI